MARRSIEDDEIAQWLLRLTDNNRNWGFGLCFLYLRNVRGFRWNYKRVYRERRCCRNRRVVSGRLKV